MDVKASSAESVSVEKLKYAYNEDIKNGQVVPVYKKALLHSTNIAIKDHQGEYTYMQLYQAAKLLSFQISNLCGSASSSRVIFVSNSSALYTVILWSCWFSGQIGTFSHGFYSINIFIQLQFLS